MTKKAKFKVGDRVRISKKSEYYLEERNSSNPKDTAGTVTSYMTTNVLWTTQVDWDNGTENSYRDADLELDTAAVKNDCDLTVDKEFVLQAYESACSTWKEKIEQKFPELFPKQKFATLTSSKPSHANLYYNTDGEYKQLECQVSLIDGVAGYCKGVPKEAKYKGIYINDRNRELELEVVDTDGGHAILFKIKN